MKDERFEKLKKVLSRIEYLNYNLNSILYWDRIVNMPKNAFGYRSELMSYIGELIYQLMAGEELRDSVDFYTRQKDNPQLIRSIIRRISELQQPIIDIPEANYRAYTRLLQESEEAWNRAKVSGNYRELAGYYQRVFDSFKDFAAFWGYPEEGYDALLGYYVNGYTTRNLDNLAEELEGPLREILASKLEREEEYQESFICLDKKLGSLDKGQQIRLWEIILDEIGFDFDSGRMDLGNYTTILANTQDDVRIINEWSEEDPLLGIFNILHSGGKAVYQQKIDRGLQGTLLAEPPSFVMEETIGRFYENILGRSQSFWIRIFERAKEEIPLLGEISPYDFYQRINASRLTTSRKEADETSYLLHILVRYELEKDLIRGELEAKDLELAWADSYEKYLGLRPQGPRQGILEDVHWASGYIGYFPTYILASLASVQLLVAMERDLGQIEELLLKEGIKDINNWLEERIFKWGAIYNFEELILSSTGYELKANHYLDYLTKKHLERKKFNE